MYHYSFIEWMLFFYIYCFLVWIIESTIVSVSEKRLINRGFFKGPFLPIYGSGAIIVLLATIPVSNSIILIFIEGMVATTILEYLTSWLMDITIKIKYWDYSKNEFNIKGRICLSSSLFWGVLSVFLTKVVHVPISKLVLNLHNQYIPFTIITIYFLFDIAYSAYNVVNLNNILSALSKLKLQIEDVRSQIKEYPKLHSSFDVNILHEKLNNITKEYAKAKSKFNFFHFQLLKSYPKASSRKFNEEFKEFRTTLKEKIIARTNDKIKTKNNNFQRGE